jgi:hypothetical protein
VIAVLVFGSRDLPERRPVWTVLNGVAAWRAEEAEPIVVIEGTARMAGCLAELADQGASIEAWGFVSKPLESSRGLKLTAGILADNGLPYQLVRVVPASSQPQVAGVPDGPTNQAPLIGRLRRR